MEWSKLPQNSISRIYKAELFVDAPCGITIKTAKANCRDTSQPYDSSNSTRYKYDLDSDF